VPTGMRTHSPRGPPPLPRRRALAFSDYLGHDVGFVASNGAHVVTATGLAPQLTCLQIPFPEVFTLSSDAKGYLKGSTFSSLSGLVPILTFGLFVLLRRTTCVLFRELVVEPSRYVSPLASPAFAFLRIVALWQRTRWQALLRLEVPMPGIVRGGVRLRECLVILVPPPLSPLPPCRGSGRRSPCILIDHIPRRPWPWYVMQTHFRSVNVLKELMTEARAIKGRDLRMEISPCSLRGFTESA
jgi:hypothetical protein